MLDTLIAVNLALSVVLLMVSLYVNSPLGLSTFPSLLLFTTLFRLSLNIAATRQILLHANAGEIIFTFGNLVVGGDIIVGIVVFLIIAIVQFVVIAKGAERVAEVGARFTLDAMPGKQMSIDADLRAGLIDKEEARTRRSLLERESHLYGAMDGAMKFVKGDAIAALIIAAVNIIAGICVGTLRKGMEFSAALDTYSVLTVGDALVSQIPSLFVSIAAGVLITRVADPGRRQGTGLGDEIAEQLRAHPRALMIAGTVIVGLMLVPGFPKLQFLLIAAVVGLVGYSLLPSRRRYSVPGETPMPSMQRAGSSCGSALAGQRRSCARAARDCSCRRGHRAIAVAAALGVGDATRPTQSRRRSRRAVSGNRDAAGGRLAAGRVHHPRQRDSCRRWAACRRGAACPLTTTNRSGICWRWCLHAPHLLPTRKRLLGQSMRSRRPCCERCGITPRISSAFKKCSCCFGVWPKTIPTSSAS